MPKTIVFIHGAWITAESWAPFAAEFKAAGYECLTPAWPFLNGSAPAIRESIDPKFANLGIQDIANSYDKIVRGLPEPPIIIGHSFGGLMTQILLDRGLGKAGVALDPAPPKGIIPGFTTLKTSKPVFLTWRFWSKIHTMSEQDFNTGFANGLPPEQQKQAYRDYVVPAPGRLFFQGAFGVGNKVDWGNPKRPPLLIVEGLEDRTVQPSMARANFKKASQAPSRTDYLEFPDRGHFLAAQPGYQEIAAKIIEWLAKNAG